jgi:hypothetical protein
MARTKRVGSWRDEFLSWLTPFLDAFDGEAKRHRAPVYLEGLLGPGERKSVKPVAARVGPGETQQLHHFVSAAPWATGPLEQVLAAVADRLVGSPDAVLIIDDTALPKQGTHSVGVARKYCGALGKKANCQVLVSLTLARDEVPVPLALRLDLPEPWASDPEGRARVKVPAAVPFPTKGELALAEPDRVRAAGVRCGLVVADAGYGTAAEFRGAARGGVRRRAGPRSRRPADGQSAAPARRTGLAGVRTSDDGRAEVLPDQPCGGHTAEYAAAGDQGALSLRAGAPAVEGGSGPQPRRGALVARAAPPRAVDDDRLRVPPASSARRGRRAVARPPPAAWGKTSASHARSAPRTVTPRDASHAPRRAPRDHRPPLPALSLRAPTTAA